MEKIIRILTCSTEIKKPPPVAPPRESLKKKNSENHYVLGPTKSTLETSSNGVPNDPITNDDEELYMDLSTLSGTNLPQPVTVTTAVTPVPPPRGVNAKKAKARKVAKMVPVIDNGFSHIPEERKAKLLKSLQNRLRKNKTES